MLFQLEESTWAQEWTHAGHIFTTWLTQFYLAILESNNELNINLHEEKKTLYT